MFGGMAGHAANAVFTCAGMFFGFKSMGPVGVAGGALAGQAAGETAKHYLGSFFGSRSSGGGAASSFSNVGELKQAVTTETKRATDEGDTNMTSAKSRLESALGQIDRATDDSGHEAVERMKLAVQQAISMCENPVLTASHTAQAKAGTWAGGL